VDETKVDRRKPKEERQAVERMQTSNQRVENRFQVNLPYTEIDAMPNNKRMAFQRMLCTERKLIKTNMEENITLK
jgi:hypothetical protein